MTSAWHISADQMGKYLGDAMEPVGASSIEAHLMRCATCRAALAHKSGTAQLERSWASIEHSIDGELDSRLERLASRAGVSDRDIRTLAPTLSLQGAWLLATLLSLVCAAFIARQAGGPQDALARVAFLTIAPLAPLAAVAAALGTASEPAPEIESATPASRLRTVAVRATTVMLAAIAAGLLASAALPGEWTDAVLWLLPALALSAVGASVSGLMAPGTVISWLGSTWVLVVAVSFRLTDDRLAAFRPPAQLLYLVITATALLTIALRNDPFELRSIS